MYTKRVPFTNYKGQARNQDVHFNLDEREIFKLLNEFNLIFRWRDSLQGEARELTTDEVQEFYTALENILLTSWGEPSEDGDYFEKGGRYKFEESKLFNAVMMMFLSDPSEANKMIDDLMPKGMEEMIRKADENLAKLGDDPKTTADLQAEIERMRAQLQSTQAPTAPPTE